jgi:hypothetical protein
MRCVGLCLQMREMLKAQGASATAVLRELQVYSYPVNATPQLCEAGTYVCQAMLKVLRRSQRMVPTTGGMLDGRVLLYLCCDMFSAVKPPTYLDDKRDFFRSGGEGRELAMHSLQFFATLAAESSLQLVINSSRGVELLHEMFGRALHKCPVAAGDVDVGYTFELEVVLVSSAGVSRTVWVRCYGTKHPCWWWTLLFILAFYRAQVANMGQCGFDAPGFERCCGQVRLLQALLPSHLQGLFEQGLFRAELRQALVESCASFNLAHPATFRNLQREWLHQGFLTESELAKTLPRAAVLMLKSIVTTENATKTTAAALHILSGLSPGMVIAALRGEGEAVLTSDCGRAWKLTDLLARPRLKGVLCILGVPDDATPLGADEWTERMPWLCQFLAAYMQHAGAGALPACARARTHCCGPAG